MRRIAVAYGALVLLVASAFAAEPAKEGLPAAKAEPAAQEQPAAKPGDDVTEPVIPKRDLKFDESDEEQPVVLREPEPRLLEQRHVAMFRFVSVPRRRPDETPGDRSIGWPSTRNDVQIWQKIYRLRALLAPTGPNDYSSQPDLRQIVGNLPADRRPAAGVLAAFGAQKVPVVTRAIEVKDGAVRYIRFEVLGTNREQAKELAAGLIQLYDDGLSYPSQKTWLELIQVAKDRMAAARTEVARLEEAIPGYRKQVEEFSEFKDISNEALASLKTQQRMLAVDLAGVKARIEACQRLLGGRPENLGATRRDQVESLKVAAEIELVGLDAKRQEIDRLIKGAEGRRALQDRVNSAGGKIGDLTRQMAQDQPKIDFWAANRAYDEPLPVLDNKVTIRRIKWESPPGPGRPGSRRDSSQ
jgi:hypothetical protein